MIEYFNDVEVRGSGVIMSSVFDQIKKMHAMDPEMAGELAISAIELVLTGQFSSDDAMIDALARDGIAYVPFFPLGGFTPLQSSTLSDVAASLGATPMQVALAWLLQRSPNILLIPGTSSVAHLRENMAAEKLHLSEEVLSTLDGISRE